MLKSLLIVKRLLERDQVGVARELINDLISDLEKPEVYTPMQGCICPPTSEQTCKGLSCPRREIKL